MERREVEPGGPPVKEVVRRDGGRERFDPARLAASIHQAAIAVGQGELLLAEELAALVALVMAEDREGGPPSTRIVRETVERTLMETGHHDVARSYILLQARDAEAALGRGARSGAGAPRGEAVQVASLGRECLEPFDPGRVTESLVLDVGLRSADAKKIAAAVERQVGALGASVVAGSTVRQLIARELLDGGRADLLARVEALGLPSPELESVAFTRAAGERAEVRLGEELLRRYSLARLLEPATAQAHLSGELHVDGLSAPGRALEATIDFGEVRRAALPGALAALLHLVHGIEPALHGTLTLAHVERALAPAFGSVAQAEEAARGLLLSLCDGAVGRSGRPMRRILGVGVDLPDRVAASLFRRGAAPDAVRERLLAFVNHLLEQSVAFASHLHLPRLRLLIDRGEEERELLAVSAGLQPALALGAAEIAHAAAGPSVRVVGARIGLNVARLGLHAGRRRESELLRALPGLVERGVTASTRILRDLLQRDEAGVGFLRRLRDVTRDLGGDLPLELSGSHAYAVEIVPVGVDAAVRAVTERDPAESEAAARLRDEIFSALSSALPERGGARFELVESPFSEAELRFGRGDFLAFPRGRDVLGLAHDGAAFRYATDPVPRSGPFATTAASSANPVRDTRPSEGTVSA
jgi:ATP cone domain-containing protein